MLLEYVEIKNFRQFYNVQKIVFSHQEIKNVTVIHGQNGFGKTALLQAILWGLYGHCNLPNKNELLNNIAHKEDSDAEIKVEVCFTHNDDRYFVVRRTWNNRPQELQVMMQDTNGNTKEIESYSSTSKRQSVINSILPEELSSYFFFDGERIRNLGDQAKGKKDLSKAVKNILGLEVLYKTKSHLTRKNGVKSKLEDSYNSEADQGLKRVVDEIKQKDRKTEEHQNQIKNDKKAISKIEERLKELAAEIKKNADAKALQIRREKNEKDIERARQRIDNSYRQIYRLISKNLYKYITLPIIDQAVSVLEKKEVSGKSVAGINAHAIDEIINRGYCICGTEIEENSEEYRKLIELKDYIPPKNMGALVNQYSSELLTIRDEGRIFLEDIKNQMKDLGTFEDEKAEAVQENSDLDKQLGDMKEIHDVEKEHANLKHSRDEYIKSIGKTENYVTQLKKERIDLEKKRTEYSSKSEENSVVDKRIKICNRVIDSIDAFIKREELNVRELLQERVNNVFNKIQHKNYHVDIDSNYEFEVRNQFNEVVGKSEGENQITSLAFISGILEIGKNKLLKDSREGKEVSYEIDTPVYPLIMDSPFGQLDRTHKKNVASIVPQMAEQVILFVSDSQWSDEVKIAMGTYVDREYMMRHNEIKDGNFTVISEVE
jgi:DNA sulfur modification protein DndD